MAFTKASSASSSPTPSGETLEERVEHAEDNKNGGKMIFTIWHWSDISSKSFIHICRLEMLSEIKIED